MFRGQMSKNTHVVRNIWLEMTLCILAYLIKFYVFVLDKIDVGGLKLIYDKFPCWKHLRKHPHGETNSP